MARYTGPKTKVSRRYGTLIHGSPKAFERKSYPPGQHGPKGSRRKLSDYALALAEKQKLRFQYGVLERQFRRYFALASSKRGVTGEILLQLLETRLDNVVQKLGFAKTLRAARQLVSHGHVTVNGRKTNASSMNVKPGDKVAVKPAERSKRLAVKAIDQTSAHATPDWLQVDKDALVGTVVRIPTRDDINPIVNEQLVVELYSR
ncbi:small subunit ribosomal protein S4 [Terrimicrobium sacchariphilum]|jgi:small subunit ribosomal protein S4|uniref:Small ribosomal subunit protein uS4 n=1 Tax=Terrimicrobium sacchariphilum TaxID=690879 RepID=A0A146GDR0_TERSA|nr:30S ribosomal protein S4 [Terrimicrobium sacchariphilum]GAT34844.1 small subunit ribosomal protein S4 [Terrimicrobium sacchariphilum]